MRVETTVSPIAVIQAFAVEQTEGQPTTPQRRDLPMAHGDAVLARIAGLPRRLGEIVRMIAYDEARSTAGVASFREGSGRQ
ncbi:hypothetical protein AAGS40_06395 [Paraburkholderia sp. PREW-6R]|uniref:hypothetical protein n=1 Tax=Paraburkholderia sp. PREW-6R TaxID=3141544 RepID=UPI0031F53654